MQITHQEARRLVQRKIDQALNPWENTVLSAHLQVCADCNVYIREMKDVEHILRPLLKRRWNREPIPLSMTLLKERNRKTAINPLLTMRKTALSLVAVALFFGFWQFIGSGPSLPGQIPPLASPAPTPSTTSTHTMLTLEGCEMALYIAQANDTLPGIAHRFSVPIEEIMEINQLKTEVLQTSMKLLIPVCSYTPARTAYPATFTTTRTPSISKPTTFTPGGSY